MRGSKGKSDSHETWKCADPELERQIRCFPYGERVKQKAIGRQRNLGLSVGNVFFLSYLAILASFVLAKLVLHLPSLASG